MKNEENFGQEEPLHHALDMTPVLNVIDQAFDKNRIDEKTTMCTKCILNGLSRHLEVDLPDTAVTDDGEVILSWGFGLLLWISDDCVEATSVESTRSTIFDKDLDENTLQQILRLVPTKKKQTSGIDNSKS